MKNEMLALILAGGQGTRLGKLTQSIANLQYSLVDVIVLLTLPCLTVLIPEFTMSVSLLNTSRWL